MNKYTLSATSRSVLAMLHNRKSEKPLQGTILFPFCTCTKLHFFPHLINVHDTWHCGPSSVLIIVVHEVV